MFIKKIITQLKPKNSFYFLEENSIVNAYIHKDNIVKKIKQFKLNELEPQLKSIIGEFPFIKNSAIFWFFENHPVEIIEKSNLNREELFEYAKFKIQEVTHIPIQDAVYDIISNNNEDSSFFKKYLTAFVVQKNAFLYITNIFKQTKLNLTSVDNTSLGLRDFFGIINENNQSCAYVKIKNNKTYINIYYGSGLVISRSFEIGSFLNEMNELEDTNKINLSDKISLEIQRIVDFLDRQHSISQFNNICFSIPNSEPFQELQNSIADYFSVQNINNEQNKSIIKSEFTSIDFEIAALTLKGSLCKEQINLLNRFHTKKSNELVDSLKKTFAISSIIGLALTVFGSFYYLQGKNFENQNQAISKDIQRIESLLNSMQTDVSTSSLSSQIKQLEQELDNILSLSSSNYKKQNLLESIIAQSIAHDLYLTELSITKNEFLISGISIAKTQASLFLNDVISKEILQEKEIKTFSIEPSQIKDGYYSFKIAGVIGASK